MGEYVSLWQWALGLFGCCLPLSVCCCAMGLLCAGFLQDPADRPKIFRFAAQLLGDVPDHPSRSNMVAFAGFVAFSNFVPVFYLAWIAVHGLTPGGVPQLSLTLLYFLIHGMWLATAARAIRRANSRHRAG